MQPNNALTIVGQAAANLPTDFNTLVDQIRNAQAAAMGALTIGIERAADVGRLLLRVEQLNLVEHGGWPDFYKLCRLSDRQAQRYKQLARLMDENPKPSSKTVLTGLTIEGAIRALQPKPDKKAPAEPKIERAGAEVDKIGETETNEVDKTAVEAKRTAVNGDRGRQQRKTLSALVEHVEFMMRELVGSLPDQMRARGATDGDVAGLFDTLRQIINEAEFDKDDAAA